MTVQLYLIAIIFALLAVRLAVWRNRGHRG